MSNQAKGRTIFGNDRGVSRFGQGANIRTKYESGAGGGCGGGCMGGCSGACIKTSPPTGSKCSGCTATCGCGSANKVKF